MPAQILGVLAIVVVFAGVWIYLSRRRPRGAPARPDTSAVARQVRRPSDGAFMPVAPATAHTASMQRRPRRAEALRRSEEPDFVAADPAFDGTGERSAEANRSTDVRHSPRGVPTIRNAAVARVSPQWIDTEPRADGVPDGTEPAGWPADRA